MKLKDDQKKKKVTDSSGRVPLYVREEHLPRTIHIAKYATRDDSVIEPTVLNILQQIIIKIKLRQHFPPHILSLTLLSSTNHTNLYSFQLALPHCQTDDTHCNIYHQNLGPGLTILYPSQPNRAHPESTPWHCPSTHHPFCP